MTRRSAVAALGASALLARRAQLHQAYLASHATGYDPPFRNQVSGLAQTLVHSGLSVPDAKVQAYGRIYQSLLAQSQALAYIDTFMVLALGAGMMFLLSFILSRNDPSAGSRIAVE